MYRIITFLALTLLCGCKGDIKKKEFKKTNQYATIKTEQNANLIKIDIPEEELFQEFYNSSIIDSVWHVKLETNKQSLFGSITKLMVYDGSIFILDAVNTKTLFEFSLKGTFIKKYGAIGKGPNEYLRPTSFGIDNKKNRIILFDDKSSKLLFFNRDGSLFKTEKLNFYTREICVFDNEQMLLNNRKAPNGGINSDVYMYYLTMIDFKGEILSKALAYDEDIINLRYHTDQDFFKSKKEVLYHPALSDTIYTVGKTKIQPKYVLNFGNKKLPGDFNRNIRFRAFKKKYMGKNQPYAYLLGQFMEIDDKLYFELSYQGHKIKCLYSLKTKALKFGGKLLADLNNDLGVFNPVGVYKNWIISSVDANTVMQKKGMLHNNNNNNVNNIINKTSISDNPILSFQHLKKF